MKRIYRSIAVTVLAALMALPMVVRAEDKIVKEIVVKQIDGVVEDLTPSYLGETPEKMMERFNKDFEFTTTIDGTPYQLEVKSIELFRHVNGGAVKRAYSIKKGSDNGGFLYEKHIELVFKNRDSHKTLKFDPNSGTPTKLTIGATTVNILNTTRLIGEPVYVEGARFKLDNTVFRKIFFSSINGKATFKNIGGNNEKAELTIPVEVSTPQKLSALLQKSGEHNNGALVEYKLETNGKFVWYVRNANGGLDIINPKDVDVSSYGVDAEGMPKADTLDFILCEIENDQKLPYLQAEDVRFKADEKLDKETLIKKAIKIATPDYFTGKNTRDLDNVKATYGGKEIDDAAFEKAKAPDGILVHYEYVTQGVVTAFSDARLFVEPAAPNPQPEPKPEPKKQEGNTYFDLGRYNLPTCPDSKCPKAGTSAKKDDVPNTAAAANN
ncbi:hypothetical protein [Mageeibacillus indolicus]|uniref:hypothetical protein n=1 Tax=Mageeibacillus indolicus TaxID=884684 RepID=UPI0004DD2971|nr:hypothetical protein [Mageeibacillus indolicus]KFA57081.1 hypothetical protein HMPREF1632_05540 [Mageeibacillus indolicus 0009-5]